MPIIDAAAPGRPLSQGDILEGVALFQTQGSESGGEHRKTGHRLCLIISRPCVVGHKPSAVVAAIERMADGVPRDIVGFDQILRFLTDMRDGYGSPDVFYIGQLPGQEGRYGVRLDSLHTVAIPQSPEGQAALAARRVGTLHRDFLHELHARLFRAFASQGFDDHSWMSTPDLRWLVARGRQEAHDARAAVEGARTALTSAEARGFRNEGEKKQLEKGVADAQKRLDDLAPALAPFEAELTAREPAAPAG